MKTTRITCSFLILLFALFLGGCNFNPVGKSEFDCNRQENNNSPYCRSFKAVLNGANTPLGPTRFDLRADQQEFERMSGIAPTGEQQKSTGARIVERSLNVGTMTVTDSAVSTVRLPHSIETPSDSRSNARAAPNTPVRQAPVLQRAWIKRHVEGDTLVEDTEVTWEVAPAKWKGVPMVGTKNDRQFDSQIVPHRAPKASPMVSGDAPTPQPTTGSPPSEFRQPGVVESAPSPAVKGDMPLPQ